MLIIISSILNFNNKFLYFVSFYISHLIFFKGIFFVLTILWKEAFYSISLSFRSISNLLNLFSKSKFSKRSIKRSKSINSVLISGSKETSCDSSLGKKLRKKERERKGAHDEDEVSFDAGIV